MNTREQLNQYLRGLESRLRWLTVSKGAAIGCGVALLVTLAMVLVTNVRNGKTVVVRIVDRGPYGRGRIIDVSRAAARELDMIGSGTAMVSVVRFSDSFFNSAWIALIGACGSMSKW